MNAPTPDLPEDPRDAETQRLLSLLHYVLGGILAVFCCFPVIHVVIGIAMVTGNMTQEGRPAPPAEFGYLFIVVGLVGIVMGLLLSGLALVSGRCLAKRKHLLFSQVVAGVLCLFMPFGTVLGVFTLIHLNKDAVKQRYGAAR